MPGSRNLLAGDSNRAQARSYEAIPCANRAQARPYVSFSPPMVPPADAFPLPQILGPPAPNIPRPEGGEFSALKSRALPVTTRCD